jgi:hypothetical protein
MNLSQYFTKEQIERVFTYHGFNVVEKEVTMECHIHGSVFDTITNTVKYVENPMSNTITPLEDAFNKLMERYLQNVLFGFTKADIIQCLITD